MYPIITFCMLLPGQNIKSRVECWHLCFHYGYDLILTTNQELMAFLIAPNVSFRDKHVTLPLKLLAKCEYKRMWCTRQPRYRKPFISRYQAIVLNYCFRSYVKLWMAYDIGNERNACSKEFFYISHCDRSSILSYVTIKWRYDRCTLYVCLFIFISDFYVTILGSIKMRKDCDIFQCKQYLSIISNINWGCNG